MEYLSHHLKGIRATQGKTQHYMADLLNIDQSKYSRKERGLDKISIEDLAIIAKDFGMTPHELLEMAQKSPYPQKK